MREIYTHGFLKADFVLVAGDLVSNVRLDEVVNAHRARRKANRDAIMTMVVKEAGARHRTRWVRCSPSLYALFGYVLTSLFLGCVCVNRSKVDSAVFVLDSETQECLYYEPVRGYPPQEHTAVPREALNGHPEVEVRNDLIDCYIDICSVEV